ncbi:HTD2 family dehydratase [Rhodovarius lipocyclicus]|uniref:FAS1-like dehydratase domain-containing protein n=1 Tax=Rhodovarius lipocyclicus TaxID=268410 RepID=UPI001359D79C|nr:MaoC family dehydratase N-terminal domain-containing protein [Rhodovarius lipocyclicus]
MSSYADFIGKTETVRDRCDPRLITGFAATLGIDPPAGDMPPLWHWMLFQDWKKPDGIGPDGHPKRGGFLPPVHHLARRMWAGGRLTFLAHGIQADDIVTRRSTILDIQEKKGGSGELVFVTVKHVISGPRGPVLEEEQDIVYRGMEGAAVKAAPAAPEIPGAISTTVMPDSLMLFRYSALTGNGHRIHYDYPYVTGEEGYPGLVVHGPLQATFLAAHALALAGPGAKLAKFSFRGQRPAFDGRTLTVLGTLDGKTAKLETRDLDGATCMKAEATLA